jgi:signal recognition particle subunit SRP54
MKFPIKKLSFILKKKIFLENKKNNEKFEEKFSIIKNLSLTHEINSKIIDKIYNEIKISFYKEFKKNKIFSKVLKKIYKEKIERILGYKKVKFLPINKRKPNLIFIIGPCGSGKTLSSIKLLSFLRKNKQGIKNPINPIIINTNHRQKNIFNPIKKKNGFFKFNTSYDSGFTNSKNEDNWLYKIVKKSLRFYSKSKNYFIFDLKEMVNNYNKSLIYDLKKIKQEYSLTVLFSLDINSQKNVIRMIKDFEKYIFINGFILNKIDENSDYENNSFLLFLKINNPTIPIYFLGSGKKISDLNHFDPKEFSNIILEKFFLFKSNKKKPIKLLNKELINYHKTSKEKKYKIEFDLNKFLKILKKFEKIDKISSTLKKIKPSIKNKFSMIRNYINNDNNQILRIAIKRIECIVNSMRNYERENPSIVINDKKRILKISKKSGVRTKDVSSLLKNWKKIEKVVKNKINSNSHKKKNSSWIKGLVFRTLMKKF